MTKKWKNWVQTLKKDKPKGESHLELLYLIDIDICIYINPFTARSY